ncbi:MAG: hypothetical protein EBV03_08940, partial [Proteobacteria bacterium]|nr:hypothetical protein [Pseudomonadota bacterium]
MKGLTTLIKLSKRALDELRRKMGMLENQKSQLQQAIVNLQREVEAELQAARQRPEMGQFFGEYSKRMRQRQAQLEAEVASIELQMSNLRETIAAAFAEQKKYEIALENAKQRQKEAAQRRENEMMDEIAGQQHQRK